MKLKHHEICIISNLISLNEEFFRVSCKRNPIRENINDNHDHYRPFGKFDGEVSQKMFNDLKHKIDLEFIKKVEWED
jgi:hypothetical protein|tara:strand:- start:1272 stop:1502 length:231 start_codon:yes stop_codon:yes gene_type:complete